MDYEAVGVKLRIGNQVGQPVEVVFPWPIKEVITIESVLVVRTEPDPGACDNQNVSAVDAWGRQIWIVSDREYVYVDSPYTKIAFQDGVLKLFNWDGLNVLVDPRSWKEISAEYTK